MADTDQSPFGGDSTAGMADTDVAPPASDAGLIAAPPLKPAATTSGETVGAGAAAEAGTGMGEESNAPVDLRQTLKDKAGELRGQATEKARAYAEDGKARATGALGELSKMLTDAADQVDAKLGNQYGQYARDAADRVQGFSASIDDKSLDELLDMGRELVRKSPGVAIGTAAAVGFVVARLLTAGFDQRDAA